MKKAGLPFTFKKKRESRITLLRKGRKAMSEPKIGELKKRLEEVMHKIEGVSPDKMTVEDIDYFIKMLDDLEEKCK